VGDLEPHLGFAVQALGGARESFATSVVYRLKRLWAAPCALPRLCFKTNRSFCGPAENYHILCK
jgi:hypothetical protein